MFAALFPLDSCILLPKSVVAVTAAVLVAAPRLCLQMVYRRTGNLGPTHLVVLFAWLF